MNMLDQITKGYHTSEPAPDEAEAVRAAFEALALPTPGKGEYYSTKDDGYLVFLEDYGLTIRLTDNDCCPAIINEHVLQPLGTLPLKEFRLDINPGVNTGAHWDSEQVKNFAGHLEENNIYFVDATAVNLGLLPYRNAEYPAGFPVVIDAGAIEVLSDGASSARNAIDWKSTVQANLYGDLKEHLDTALSSHCPSSMRDFWAACKNKKEQGVLVTGWKDINYRKISDISKSYALRLRQEPTHRQLTV